MHLGMTCIYSKDPSVRKNAQRRHAPWPAQEKFKIGFQTRNLHLNYEVIVVLIRVLYVLLWNNSPPPRGNELLAKYR